MALSGIETPQDLYNVLDAIYNNLNTYDTYSSVKLYYNEIQRTSTIFKVEADGTESVIAILSLEGISAETKVYLARLVKSSISSGDEARVYDVGLGAYIGIDQLIKNICVSLGVSLSNNFASDNPQIYSELYGIIEKYYGSILENNTPYMLRKTLSGDITSYNTFIPLNIIVEFAVYLNKLGLFNKAKKLLYPELLIEGVKFSDMFGLSIMSSSEFKDLLLYRYNSFPDTVSTINELYDLYENEFSDSSVKFARGSTSLEIIEIDPSCYIKSFQSYYIFGTKYFFTISSDEDFIVRKYGKFYGKIVTEHKKGDIIKFTTDSTYIDFIGLNNKKLYIPYAAESFKYYDITRYRQIYSTRLTSGLVSRYKSLNMDMFKNIIAVDLVSYNSIINHFNLSYLNDDKFIVFTTGYTYVDNKEYPLAAVFICDKNNMKFDNSKNNSVRFGLGSGVYTPAIPFKEYREKLYLNRSTSYESISGVSDLDSNALDYDVYLLENNSTYRHIKKSGFTIELTSDELGGLNLSYLFYSFINLGEIVDNKDPESLSGMSLIENSVYPDTVIDMSSFITKYPNWLTYGLSNPVIVNGVVQTEVKTESWGACSISSSITTQEEAQNGIITDSDINNIIKDLDGAINDDDSESETIDPEVDPDVDPNSDSESENKGNTPDLPVDTDLPNVLAGGCINQYKMSETQLLNFAEKCLSGDIWSTIAKLFNNPVDAVISLQMGYVYNAVGGQDSAVTFNGHKWEDVSGYKLSSQYVDLPLGEVDIAPYFNNYTDYTDTSMSLFLPFVGYVNLNISDFINGKIKLDCRVDTLTGVIIYYIYSIRNNTTQLLSMVDGNCQLQVPLASADYSRLYSAIFGVASAGVGLAGAVASSSMLSEQSAINNLSQAMNNRSIMQRAEDIGMIDESWDLSEYRDKFPKNVLSSIKNLL